MPLFTNFLKSIIFTISAIGLMHAMVHLLGALLVATMESLILHIEYLISYTYITTSLFLLFLIGRKLKALLISNPWLPYTYTKPLVGLVNVRTRNGNVYWFKSVERFKWIRNEASLITHYQPVRFLPRFLELKLLKLQESQEPLV